MTSTRGRGATRATRVAQPAANVEPASIRTAIIFFMGCSFHQLLEKRRMTMRWR
jgi:hypothetical protein